MASASSLKAEMEFVNPTTGNTVDEQTEFGLESKSAK